jgi:hypothetical protein
MARGRGPWRDGFRAWERLNGWHQDAPHASPGHPDDGDEALDALSDIGLVRHLLDASQRGGAGERVGDNADCLLRSPRQEGIIQISTGEPD